MRQDSGLYTASENNTIDLKTNIEWLPGHFQYQGALRGWVTLILPVWWRMKQNKPSSIGGMHASMWVHAFAMGDMWMDEFLDISNAIIGMAQNAYIC